MKTFSQRKAALERLEPLGLKPGDWVWLRMSESGPLQKAQLIASLAVVTMVIVESVEPSDDGRRLVTADQIEGPA